MTKKNKTAVNEESEQAAQAALPNEGHNSKPGLNPALVKLFETVEELDKRTAEINKAKRQIRIEAKEKHGVPVMAFSHELRMRKLQPEVRREFEHDCDNVKHMVGYQFALQLAGGEKVSDEVDPAKVAQEEKKKEKENKLKSV